MRIIKIALSIVLSIFIFSCGVKQDELLSSEKKSELEQYLITALEVHDIPGLALAIIEDDEVVYKGCFGNASIERNVPVDSQTIFRIFSATKLITATGIFQLIEKGKISQEDKLSKYFSGLPDGWKQIKIKNLLTHSSGLPDLRYPASLSNQEVMEGLFKDEMNFETGNQFRYNQTNYWLLSRIIESVSGLSFDEYIARNQFKDSEDGILFSSNSKDEIPNRAVRYYYDSESSTFRKDTINAGKRAHSGNGLNISLNEFIGWDKRLNNNKLLNEETKNQMWIPFEFMNGKDKFLHGWGVYTVDGRTSYGFTGGNLAGFRKFVNDNNMTIILLSNGYVHPGYDIIINDVAKIAYRKLDAQKLILEQDVMKLMLNRQYQDTKTTFNKLRKEDPDYGFDNLKWNINSIGNSFFRKKNIEEACSVYRLNAKVNPDWWVALAGYAEGLEKKGDIAKASDFYQKAILLNVNNEYNYNTFMTKKIEELKKTK